jgi:hypothetical protein
VQNIFNAKQCIDIITMDKPPVPLSGVSRKDYLASAVRVFDLLAMHLPGSRWEEIELASTEHVLGLLAVRLPESRWKETNFASAVHVLKLLAMHLAGSR